MTWFKVDDSLAFHAKTVAAGNTAMGLWVRAGSWCAQQLTDGHVPGHILAVLGGKSKDAAALVVAGLWDETPNGWRFHDWDHHNPSAEEVMLDRSRRHEAKVRAGRVGGVASGVTRRRNSRSKDEPAMKQAASICLASAEAKRSPVPTRPDPSRKDLGLRSKEEVEVELPAATSDFANPLRADLDTWPAA